MIIQRIRGCETAGHLVGLGALVAFLWGGTSLKEAKYNRVLPLVQVDPTLAKYDRDRDNVLSVNEGKELVRKEIIEDERHDPTRSFDKHLDNSPGRFFGLPDYTFDHKNVATTWNNFSEAYDGAYDHPAIGAQRTTHK